MICDSVSFPEQISETHGWISLILHTHTSGSVVSLLRFMSFRLLKDPFHFSNVIKVYVTMNCSVIYQSILVYSLSVIVKNKN